MSSTIRDNLPLLTALLTKGAHPAAGSQSSEKSPNGGFSERLERALGSADPESTSAPFKAQALAETLKLQMLHSSLSLGDNSGENIPQLFNHQSPQFQNLVMAYTAQQPETPPQSSSNMDKSSQLQELADAPSGNVTQPRPTESKGTQAIDTIIAKASHRYGVDSGLIRAVIKAESGFNPNAVSHAGAQGLMQLMPGTARALGVSDSFDPEQNVMAGTRFLSDLLKRYNGSLDSALAAYNWGPGNVDRKPEQLPRETRDYLARVKQLYRSYSV